MPYKKATSGKTGMTVIYSGDSSVLVKKNGTLAWRNNNPGNLVCSPFSKRHGAIGCNKGKAVFPDIETGRKAQTSLLRTKDYQSKTIAQAMEKYAPPTENNTDKYTRYITKQTGMSRDKKLGDMTPAQFDSFRNSTRRYENLAPGTEATLPNPDKVSPLLHSHGKSTGSASSGRTLKCTGDTVYRIENGRFAGSFTCNGKKK
ncbi:MAG: hypothetical protein HZB85_03220 [Deltaproteobacteria bacterium]|nr:hypothetical protein [Deltaproteobacteria bacterium]